MRTGGAFFTPVGGHWRDLLALAVARARPRLHARHVARRAVPRVRRRVPVALRAGRRRGARARALRRGARARRRSSRTSRTRSGILGEGLDYDDHAGELDLDPVVARLGQLVPFVVAEINEPDHSVSPHIKDGYRHVERALRAAGREVAPAAAAPAARGRWTGRRSSAAATRCPTCSALADRLDGARVLVTGGAGSIGRVADQPARRVPARAHHRPRLARGGADRRPPRRRARCAWPASSTCCATSATARAWRPRRRGRGPTSSSTSPPTSTSTGPSATRSSSRRRTSTARGTCCARPRRPARGRSSSRRPTRPRGRRTSTGRTKRMMETLTALAAERTGEGRAAVRLVNVLGSAGSATELWLRQARARRAADAHRPDDGALLDHDGARRGARRAGRAGRGVGRAARHRARPGRAADRRGRDEDLGDRRRRRARHPHRRRAAGRDDERGARRPGRGARRRAVPGRRRRSPARRRSTRPRAVVAEVDRARDGAEDAPRGVWLDARSRPAPSRRPR